MVPATTEGMIQGHENWCEQDLNTLPIRVLRRDGTEAQYLPMRQPVQLWEEVDPATPFLDGGSTRTFGSEWMIQGGHDDDS